jgi:hypothetical protein
MLFEYMMNLRGLTQHCFTTLCAFATLAAEQSRYSFDLFEVMGTRRVIDFFFEGNQLFVQ